MLPIVIRWPPACNERSSPARRRRCPVSATGRRHGRRSEHVLREMAGFDVVRQDTAGILILHPQRPVLEPHTVIRAIRAQSSAEMFRQCADHPRPFVTTPPPSTKTRTRRSARHWRTPGPGVHHRPDPRNAGHHLVRSRRRPPGCPEDSTTRPPKPNPRVDKPLAAPGWPPPVHRRHPSPNRPDALLGHSPRSWCDRAAARRRARGPPAATVRRCSARRHVARH